MILKTLALAAPAASLLLIPKISKADEDIFSALPIHADTFQPPATAYSQSLAVPCVECRPEDSQLQLDFAVVDDSTLTLNGFELYPNTDPWQGDLVAAVVGADGESKDKILGYSLAVSHDGRDDEQQMEVIHVELKVIEIGSRFVDRIPAVKVSLVKGPAEHVMIAGIDIKELEEVTCDSMLCRAKEVLGSFLKSAHGCSRGRHGASRPHDGHGSTMASLVAPSGHQSNGLDSSPNWVRVWTNVAAYIFLPVLMGIAAGVIVACCVVFVCSVIARLMVLFGSKRSQQFWPAIDSLPVYDDSKVAEKSALMEDYETPPQYEEDSAKQ